MKSFTAGLQHLGLLLCFIRKKISFWSTLVWKQWKRRYFYIPGKREQSEAQRTLHWIHQQLTKHVESPSASPDLSLHAGKGAVGTQGSRSTAPQRSPQRVVKILKHPRTGWKTAFAPKLSEYTLGHDHEPPRIFKAQRGSIVPNCNAPPAIHLRRPICLLHLLPTLTINLDVLRPFPRLGGEDHQGQPMPGGSHYLGSSMRWEGWVKHNSGLMRDPPFLQLLPWLGAPGCGPGVMRQISGILGQILRAKFVFKSWKEIYHCETTLQVKSWALGEITNICNQIIFTMEISNSSYFLLCFYNSLGKGIFLSPTFQISTAELRHYACWNIWERKKISHYCCFLQPSVPSMPPLLKSHSNILLADMTPCSHLIRCGVPHGMNKYLSATAY